MARPPKDKILTRLPPDIIHSKKDLKKRRAFFTVAELDAHLIKRGITMTTVLNNLEAFEIRYKAGDPLALLDSFIYSLDYAKIFPPPWVMKNLYSIFKKYQSKKGEKSLDELFSLDRIEGQRYHPLQLREKANIYLAGCSQVHLLATEFEKISVAKACKMVVEKADQLKGLETITPNTLWKKYKNLKDYLPTDEHVIAMIHYWKIKPKEKLRWLAGYSVGLIPKPYRKSIEPYLPK